MGELGGTSLWAQEPVGAAAGPAPTGLTRLASINNGNPAALNEMS